MTNQNEMLLILEKEGVNSLFSKVRFISTIGKYSNFSKDEIIKMSYKIYSNEKIVIPFKLGDDKLHDLLVELSEQNLHISIKEKRVKNDSLDLEKIKSTYFEDSEIEDYCLYEDELLIHISTKSVIIIENDEDWQVLKEIIPRCSGDK